MMPEDPENPETSREQPKPKTMSKLEDLNSEKFRLPEQVMKNVRGGKNVERTEGNDDADKNGEATGDEYSTAADVKDHCDFTTPQRDYVQKGGPCGVLG
jgi:hypothetical protein